MNPNKSNGSDNISIRMLQICDNWIIFRNVIDTGIYPYGWNYTNVTPIQQKKG